MIFTDRHDTIVAPATPSGEGGIGIVRLSGPQAETVLETFFKPGRKVARFESHRLYHGHMVDRDGRILDEVMAVLMRRPRSYTREDVAEIHCHGGPQVMRRLLDLCIDAGLRLARPGEFTLRAFLNGRLDLAQAEAVIDVIRSASEAACHVALGQLEGKLSGVLHRLREQLVEVLALVEAHVDFPEDDIEHPDQQRLRLEVVAVQRDIEKLLAGFDAGRTLREGISVLILGKPNVGKSSLLNALLGEARAIVTSIAGTTRDTIEENLALGGIPLRLIDTAGIRQTIDPIEAEGVRRARSKVPAADLVLLVVDGSRPLDADDLLAFEACREANTLLVVNKGDLPLIPLPPSFVTLPQVAVSAQSGEGVARLRDAISAIFLHRPGGEGPESVLLSDRRHREALVRAAGALDHFLAGLAAQFPPELLALEVREALQAIGEVTGETTPEEVLDHIFSRFCIGK